MRLVPDPLGVVSALPLFTPGKKRTIPCRAVSVRIVLLTVSRCAPSCPSMRPKKKVLFRTIGPPRLAVYCCLLYQNGVIPCRLFDHEFASKAELRMFQVAPP